MAGGSVAAERIGLSDAILYQKIGVLSKKTDPSCEGPAVGVRNADVTV